jgi:hypothetical protein
LLALAVRRIDPVDGTLAREKPAHTGTASGVVADFRKSLSAYEGFGPADG